MQQEHVHHNLSLSLCPSVSTEGMLLEGGNKRCHSQISSVTGYCTTAEALTHHPAAAKGAQQHTHTSLQSDWTLSWPELDADGQIIYTTAVKHLKHTLLPPSLPCFCSLGYINSSNDAVAGLHCANLVYICVRLLVGCEGSSY